MTTTPRSTKLWMAAGLVLLLVLAFAGISQAVGGGGTDDRPMAPARATSAAETDDVSGPCDEAEHADDPRCTGVQPTPAPVAPAPAAAPAVVAGQDVSGPCDEPEHANDPRCTGGGAVRPEDDGDDDDDISGPCDEAEHANDPRCTGAPRAEGDNSGPGNAEDRDDDEVRVDNSGPGNAEDRDGGDDRSGHGGGDDDRGDDRGGDDDGGDDD